MVVNPSMLASTPKREIIPIAMFSWFQLTLVGVPVLLLIDTDDVTARYFVQIGLVFLACM